MFTKTLIDKEHQLSLKSKGYLNRFLFSFFLPGFFLLTVIICSVLMSQEVTNLIYVHCLQIAITTPEGGLWAYPFIKIPLTDNPPTLSVGPAGGLNPRPPAQPERRFPNRANQLMPLLNLMFCGLRP